MNVHSENTSLSNKENSNYPNTFIRMAHKRLNLKSAVQRSDQSQAS